MKIFIRNLKTDQEVLLPFALVSTSSKDKTTTICAENNERAVMVQLSQEEMMALYRSYIA